MGIFSRFNRVLKSNLNNLVDKAEDPAKLINQTIVEMEAELKNARKELVQTLGTAKRLDKKRAEYDEEVAKWEDKAVLALRSGDEELAREALKMKQRSLKQAEDAGRQAAEQDKAARQMQDTLEDIESKIEDLKARKTTLAAKVRRRVRRSAAAERPHRPARGRGRGARRDRRRGHARRRGALPRAREEVGQDQGRRRARGAQAPPGRVAAPALALGPALSMMSSVHPGRRCE